MAVVVKEVKGSHSLQGTKTFQYEYVCWGTWDIEVVAQAVFDASPTNFGFWIRQWNDKTITPQGGGFWTVSVPYGVGDYPVIGAPGAPIGPGGAPPLPPPTPAPNDTLGREWSFDFSSGTVHIGFSKKVMRARKFDNSPIVNQASAEIEGLDGGAPIGVDADGKVGGCDVSQGAQRWTYTTKLQVMTMGYMQVIESLKDKVNSVTFLNRAPGEVLFAGGNVVAREADGFTGTFTFDISPNRTDLQLTNYTTGFTLDFKRGWDLLDVRYASITLNGKVTETISEVWVHQVYDYDDLNVLGLFI